jgi:hypothetical protein
MNHKIYESLTPFEKSLINAALFTKGVDACVELQAFLDACRGAEEDGIDTEMLDEAYKFELNPIDSSEDYH